MILLVAGDLCRERNNYNEVWTKMQQIVTPLQSSGKGVEFFLCMKSARTIRCKVKVWYAIWRMEERWMTTITLSCATNGDDWQTKGHQRQLRNLQRFFFQNVTFVCKIHLQNNVPRKNPNNWNPTLSTCNIARPSSSSSETPFFKFDMLKPTPYLPRYDRAVFCVCIFAVFSQLARIPAIISLHTTFRTNRYLTDTHDTNVSRLKTLYEPTPLLSSEPTHLQFIGDDANKHTTNHEHRSWR